MHINAHTSTSSSARPCLHLALRAMKAECRAGAFATLEGAKDERVELVLGGSKERERKKECFHCRVVFVVYGGALPFEVASLTAPSAVA